MGDPSNPFGVTARATSRTGDDVELEIVLPEGVIPLAGNPKSRGRRCEARVDLRANDRTRREILVRAVVTHGTARMVRVVPLVIFDGPRPSSKSKATVNSRGEPILEFSP